MTLEEAYKIFNIWQAFQESHDKLVKMFLFSVPESLLPFPAKKIVEAMSVYKKYCQDMGDTAGCRVIDNSLPSLIYYQDDKKAIDGLIFKLGDQGVKESIINNLNNSRVNWLSFNIKQNNLNEDDYAEFLDK